MSTQPSTGRRRIGWLAAIAIASALLVFIVAALLTSMVERKQEARNPYVRLVEVNEETTDPAAWGVNWARQYNDYLRTAEPTKTQFGGSESLPAQKSAAFPWLPRMFAGYAFSIDFRDRRGHAYMLHDQEQTERVTTKAQPGACLHCHASATTTWRRVGLESQGKGLADVGPFDFDWPSVMKGFERMSTMSYADAYAELARTPDGTGTAPAPAKGGASPAPTTRESLAAHGHANVHPVA